MEYPICQVCLKNEILCSSCTNLVKEQKIPNAEVKLYRHLNQYLKEEKHLENIKIKRALGNEDFVLLITSKNGVSKIIGKNGIVIKKLSKAMNKQIRVISEDAGIEELAKEVLFSSTILGVNILYTPEGKKYKIRIPFNDRINLSVEPETFSDIANSIFNSQVELVFE